MQKLKIGADTKSCRDTSCLFKDYLVRYEISDLSHNDDYYAYTLDHIATPLQKATRLEMVSLCPAWDTSAINQ